MVWFWSILPKRSAIVFTSILCLVFFAACSGNKKQTQTSTDAGDTGSLTDTPTTTGDTGSGLDLTNPSTDPTDASLPAGTLANCLSSDSGLGLTSSTNRGTTATTTSATTNSASCLSASSTSGYDPSSIYGAGVRNIGDQMQCLVLGLQQYDQNDPQGSRVRALIAVTQCMLGALNTLRQAAPLNSSANGALLGNMQRIMSVFGNIRD